MPKELKLLKDIHPNMENWKAKVIAVKKFDPTTLASNRTYQRILLADEEVFVFQQDHLKFLSMDNLLEQKQWKLGMMTCPVCYKYIDVEYKEEFSYYCEADVVGTPRCRANLEVKDDWTSFATVVYGETAQTIFSQIAKNVMQKA
ncbi:hypothetical protein Sjap_026197 [Stephania japonica]|uniref:Uncharacterized protein n=1 Tax=Stephania japonica TaxID=461633 RepID=A0AAP0HIN2_9MAGN